MKIGEAQQVYREQVKSYQAEKAEVSKRLKTLQSKMEKAPDRQALL